MKHENELSETFPLCGTHYFLVASGAAGAGAGAAAGAAGAGASAGFASSFGFSGALALHPIPIETTLITKTMAKKR